MAYIKRDGIFRFETKDREFKWKGTWGNWSRTKTVFGLAKDGYSGSTTFKFKNTDGIQKIEIRAPFLSAYGGPIRGDVHIERHESRDVRIAMKGFIESDSEEEGKKFLEQMVPEVEADGSGAALRHAFPDLDALPGHIRSASMEYEVIAPEDAAIILSEKDSGAGKITERN